MGQNVKYTWERGIESGMVIAHRLVGPLLLPSYNICMYATWMVMGKRLHVGHDRKTRRSSSLEKERTAYDGKAKC